MSDIPSVPLSARILVVEDEPAIRGLLVRVLTSSGYTVEAVTSGEMALEALAANPADLILLDVGLPGANGFEVCRAIKRNPATRLTPVVLVTGLYDSQVRMEGIEAGADDFLAKPYDRAALIAKVGSLIRMKK